MIRGQGVGKRVGRFVPFALLALFLLHNDLWWWNDARLVWGLPVGLAYHFAFCIVTTGVMALAARHLTARDQDRSDN